MINKTIFISNLLYTVRDHCIFIFSESGTGTPPVSFRSLNIFVDIMYSTCYIFLKRISCRPWVDTLVQMDASSSTDRLRLTSESCISGHLSIENALIFTIEVDF